ASATTQLPRSSVLADYLTENRCELLNSLDAGGFIEKRIGNWLIVFNRVVRTAACLRAIPVMIDDEGNGDAVDRDVLVKAILFHLFRIAVLLLAQIKNFCRHAVIGGKLVIDPETIRIGQSHRFVSSAYDSGFAPAHVFQSRSL